MIKERFEAVRENDEKTRRCHCACVNSDAVAAATGQGVAVAEEPCHCSCTCWCSAGMAAHQRNDDTSSASKDAVS